MKSRNDLLYKRKCALVKLTAPAGREWARVTVSEVPQRRKSVVGGRGEAQLRHKLIYHDQATNCQAACGHTVGAKGTKMDVRVV